MTGQKREQHTESAFQPYAGIATEDDEEALLPQLIPVMKKHKPLSLLPLVALIFYEVSGGPFGIEDAVSTGGPLLAVLGFLVLPLVWSVPEALVTAELATTFPENSGYVAWVTAAFGPFWGYQEGVWSWLSGVTDNAVYPVMFMTYLEAGFPGVISTGWQRTLFLFAFALLLSYLNYRGLAVVGGTAVAMAVFIVIPFLVMTGLAAPHIKPRNWVLCDLKTVQWGPFINVMFWNLNYWDSVSTLAGEVPKPHKTFPKALAWAVVLVVAMYLIPLLVGLGVTSDFADWKLGFFSVVAERIGGRWLGVWMVAAACASQIGQFEAEMSSDSFQLLGMAERGFLPRFLAHRSKHGTPTFAIMGSSLGILLMVPLGFLKIVELLNLVYCLAQLMEFASILYLRRYAPHLHRPYRVPVSSWGLVLMLLPATCLLLVLLALPILRLDWQVICFTGGAIALSSLSYPLLQLARKRGWCEFSEVTPAMFRQAVFDSVPNLEALVSDGLISRPSDAGADLHAPPPPEAPRLGRMSGQLSGLTSDQVLAELQDHGVRPVLPHTLSSEPENFLPKEASEGNLDDLPPLSPSGRQWSFRRTSFGSSGRPSLSSNLEWALLDGSGRVNSAQANGRAPPHAHTPHAHPPLPPTGPGQGHAPNDS